MLRYAAAAEVLRGNVDAACSITAAAAAAAATAPPATADASAALRSCILSSQVRKSSSSFMPHFDTVQSHALRSKISSAGAGAAASSQLHVAAIETAQEAARVCPYDLQAWLALCKA